MANSQTFPATHPRTRQASTATWRRSSFAPTSVGLRRDKELSALRAFGSEAWARVLRQAWTP